MDMTGITLLIATYDVDLTGKYFEMIMKVRTRLDVILILQRTFYQ